MSGEKVLLVDDDRDILTLVAMRLTSAGYSVRTAESAERALAMFAVEQPQLLITDLMGGRIKLTGKFNQQTVEDDNVYQVTLDKKINPQPEYVLGTYFYHMDGDRKSTRLNSSHIPLSRMPSSA